MKITYSPSAQALLGDVIRQIEATERAFLETLTEVPLAVALFLGIDPADEGGSL